MFTSLGDQVPQTISGDHIVSHSRSQDHCHPAKPTLESISIIIGCAPPVRFSLSTRIRICMLTIYIRPSSHCFVGWETCRRGAPSWPARRIRMEWHPDQGQCR